MKKSTIILLILGAFVLIVFMSVRNSYNKMVRMDEAVSGQWAQVENVYQRRADLIPNLVATVKGYASHERETLEAVINARSKASQLTVDPSKLDPAALQNFEQAQGELTSALGRLMVVIERYPDLKANQNFITLQTQLEGTENRITIERQKFNESAKAFNTYIRTFPQNIYANMFSFERKMYFEAVSGAETAPIIDFKSE